MKKAHFIGISGIGMSATAEFLRQSGWKVTGSDSGFYPPASDYLKSHGFIFKEGYRAENIPPDVDLIVIGKNAKLVPEENAEVKSAFDRGVSVRSFPEVLESLVSETKNIVVAGSFGKSTCTALLAHCLEHAGKDPSYFIGALPLSTNEMVRLGKSDTFVLEGDEYPSSNWDHTSKFLHYHPHDVLLTSAEHDHVNIFPTHEEYLIPFKTLLSIIPPDGLVVACADDDASRALALTHIGKKILYGLSDPHAEWVATDIVRSANTTFTLEKLGAPIIELETNLLGSHNILNIVGVAAMLIERGLLTPEEVREGVRTFRGIRRRLDLKSEKTSVPIYEGFGSSYAKAHSAIEAIRLHFPDRRLLIIFEPHTFSWRNRETLHWYNDIFKGASHVLLYEPASHGAATHEQVTQEEILERITTSGTSVTAIHDTPGGISYLRDHLEKNDVVLLLTSGELGGLIEAIPRLAEELYPR